MATGGPLAVLRGVEKHYGGVQALTGVDLEIHCGRVHAICGENGAGKSTLMRIIAGVERPDAGAYRFDGRSMGVNAWRDLSRSVAVVFQELSLFPDLDVLANLFLQREPLRAGLVDRGRMMALAAPVLADLGVSVDVRTIVQSLSLAEQQLVEIAKALLANARLLILDEPNSALTAMEGERLFAVIRRLKQSGVAILFISHRLEEIFSLSDWITVLRNGTKVRDCSIAVTDVAQIVSDMVGSNYSSKASRQRNNVEGGTPLSFDRVSAGRNFIDVSFDVGPGEVLGLAGLDGSGVAVPFELMFGRRRPTSGDIRMPNGSGAPSSSTAAVLASVALVPADRRTDGLALDQDIAANIATVSAGVLGRCGAWLNQSQLERLSSDRAGALRLVYDSLRQPVRSLSGGNQQKVVLAKWLESDPRILLLDDPTRGVDIGAKAEIYRIIAQQAEIGRILLFRSTELQEFSEVCHRVLIFYRGRVIGALSGAQIREQALLRAINFGKMDFVDLPSADGAL